MEKTIRNLTKAFIGESQARNRYTFFAKVAKKEGYEQIAEIFLTTAENEKEHAKRLFEHIISLKEKMSKKSDEINVDAEAPIIYGDTEENLKSAIDGEHYENTQMYPEFVEVAEKEGLEKIATRLRSIAIAEGHHEERYRKLFNQVKNKTVFKKSQKVWWVCRECGYVHFGIQAPKKCPSCDHPQAFYQVLCEKY